MTEVTPDNAASAAVLLRLRETLGAFGDSPEQTLLARAQYYVRTVTALEAEVESERKLRLRAEGLCSAWITRHDFALDSLNEATALRNAHRDRADAAERRAAELEAFIMAVRTECFDYFNEGIRPWPHHMQTLAWKADEVLTGAGAK